MGLILQKTTKTEISIYFQIITCKTTKWYKKCIILAYLGLRLTTGELNFEKCTSYISSFSSIHILQIYLDHF